MQITDEFIIGLTGTETELAQQLNGNVRGSTGFFFGYALRYKNIFRPGQDDGREFAEITNDEVLHA